MKRSLQFLLYTVVIVLSGWLALTIYAEKTGPRRTWTLGEAHSNRTVLIVYDPDPFYDFDEQVCRTFGKVLAEKGMNVKVASVAVARELDSKDFSLLVLCSNTYNWGPDWALTRYIDGQNQFSNKPVIAITLGSGSTDRSQRKLEQRIINHGGNLIGSRSLWLFRPNDEGRMKESNVDVALSITKSWASSLSARISRVN